jgi:integrase
MHDLRRTLGSWQALAGVSTAIIGKSLGHQSQATTMIYAQLTTEPVRAAVTAATDSMLALLPASQQLESNKPTCEKS